MWGLLSRGLRNPYDDLFAPALDVDELLGLAHLHRDDHDPIRDAIAHGGVALAEIGELGRGESKPSLSCGGPT